MMGRSQSIAFSDDDRAAIDRLGRTFRGSLLSYFRRRVRETAELEDMVQEVFLRLIKRGNTCALEDQNLDAYVFETASSVLKDWLRKRVSHHAAAHEPFDATCHGDVDFSAEHVLLEKDKLARATAVLLELPERTRVVFVLRRLEGMRYKDIAARLGISVSATEKHMQRAVAHLAQRIDR